jgi:hypothetical protein
MDLPKWFIDAALEDASTLKTPCAIRYYTHGLFLPIEPGEVDIRLPSGDIARIPATEASQYQETAPYWRVWRGYDTVDQALKAVREDWLVSALHNTNVGHPWEPVQVICRPDSVIKQWLTPEDAEKDLGITRRQASERVRRQIWGEER